MEILFESVSKQYKDVKALDDLCFSMKEGIYGLLGPNGAGKSTMMKLLVGNLKTTSGRILLDGQEISSLGDSYKRMIGYMPQQQELYPFFTGRRFLNYMATLKGMEHGLISQSIEELAKKVNLSDVIDKKIGGYSGGMKQRLLIAQAFIGDPKIIIFDEPTAGLDPKERIRVRNLISENSSGKIVLIATHVVQDIEYIANEIVLLKNGLIVDMAAPEKLTSKLEGKVWEAEIGLESVEDYLNKYKVSNASRHAGYAKIRFISEQDMSKEAVRVSPDLEDVYLYVFDKDEGEAR